jgi:hypothetical protein
VVVEPVEGVGVVGIPTKAGEVVVANFGADAVPSAVCTATIASLMLACCPEWEGEF